MLYIYIWRERIHILYHMCINTQLPTIISYNVYFLSIISKIRLLWKINGKNKEIIHQWKKILFNCFSQSLLTSSVTNREIIKQS